MGMLCYRIIAALALAAAATHGSEHQGPTTVTRRKPIPASLDQEWFLCKRGSVVTACHRNQMKMYMDQQQRARSHHSSAGQPIPPAALRVTKILSRSCTKDKCMHGTCVGSRCVCEAGWKGRYCGRDIDECARRKRSICAQRCVNTLGSYRCECWRNYDLDSDGRSCRRGKRFAGLRQVQHVVRSSALAAHTSTCNKSSSGSDSPPGTKPGDTPCNRAKCQYRCVLVSPTEATCICPKGYKLSRNGRRCLDVNECKMKKRLCGRKAICHNTLGSYQCKCRRGFVKMQKMRNMTRIFKCEDINECLTGEHRCGAYGVCQNRPGSYTCRCKRGAKRKGRGCAKMGNGTLGPDLAGNSNSTLTADSIDNKSERFGGSNSLRPAFNRRKFLERQRQALLKSRRLNRMQAQRRLYLTRILGRRWSNWKRFLPLAKRRMYLLRARRMPGNRN